MLPLIMAVCAAAGAVAGALAAKAATEKDRQAVKRYEKINTELINSQNKLQKQYYELTDQSKQQISDLNRKLAESELEKDALYLAVRSQNELIHLMEKIDRSPSLEILAEFKKAVVLTNYVLIQLGEELVPISSDYFSRALIRVDRSNNYTKEQLFNYMAVLMNSEPDTVAACLTEVENNLFQQQGIGSKNIINNNQTPKIKIIDFSKSVYIDDLEELVNQGKQYLYIGQYDRALHYFNKAIAIEYNLDCLYYYKCLSFYCLNKYKQALNSIDKAISINSSLGSYYYLQSLCLSEIDLKNEAIKSLNKAIHLEPDEDVYYFEKSNLLCLFEDYQQALYFIDCAIDIQSNIDDYKILKNKIIELINP